MSQINLDWLRTLPLFRGLDDEEMRAVARCCQVLDFSLLGQVVFEMGAASDGAYIVEEGRINVELPLLDGSFRTVAQLGPGTTVGELCLIEDAPRTLRVRTDDAARLVVINREAFSQLRESGHSGAYKLIRTITLTVCDRLRTTNAQIEGRWKGETESKEADSSVANLRAQSKSPWDKLRTLFKRS